MKRIVLAALLITPVGCGPGVGTAAAKEGCRMTELPDRDRINDALGHVPDRPSPLGRAVLCDDEAGVEAALKAGADPDAREPGGETPVIFAAAIPRTAILQRLLAAGGDANAYEKDAGTLALTYALSAGVNYDDWSAWDALLAGGADINFRPPGGATIAEEAVSLGAIDRLLALLDRGYSNDPARLARALETSRFDAKTEPKRLQALERVRAIRPAQ
jgi:ankyrin repeat protein